MKKQNLGKAIRDYRKCTKRPGEAKSVEMVELQRVEMEKFMAGYKDHKLASLDSPPKVANMLNLRALDHGMMVTLRRGLADFVLRLPIKGPRRDEERYAAENEDLPAQFRREGACRRCCLEDKVTGATRFELPAEVLAQDSLFIFSDQGSAGWPGYLYLFTWIDVMGFVFYDVCHHVVNEIENALKAAQCWFFVRELILVLNLVLGPFSGAAWFHTVAKGLDDYLAGATWRCPLFQYLYEWIAEDIGETSSAEFGDPSHLKKVFAAVDKARAFIRTGTRVKK